ncbi:MAG: HAD family hydrolase [Promethearchaeota archaeon]
MIQLIAMDLDNTLAEYNRPIQPETIKLLQQLQKIGLKLVFTSGKPTSYLAGLVRQVGMENIILVGDNGGVITFNHEYPPKKSIIMEIDNTAKEELKIIRDSILKEFGDRIWVQPNEITFSLFGKDIDIIIVYNFCDRVFREKQFKHLKSFKTGGALDILPFNIDKGIALKFIQKELNIPIADTAVIGDGSNDFPMFLQGKIRITFPKSAQQFINLEPKVVPTINAALKFLIDLVQFERNTILDTLT